MIEPKKDCTKARRGFRTVFLFVRRRSRALSCEVERAFQDHAIFEARVALVADAHHLRRGGRSAFLCLPAEGGLDAYGVATQGFASPEESLSRASGEETIDKQNQ